MFLIGVECQVNNITLFYHSTSYECLTYALNYVDQLNIPPISVLPRFLIDISVIEPYGYKHKSYFSLGVLV